MAQDISIFWFRRDLRLDDNLGLFKALTSKHPVLPVFIFDSEILENLQMDDARVTFIHNKLNHINSQLNTLNSGVAIYHGKPLDIYKKLIKEFSVKAVYTNHDYEPYAKERDEKIKSFLNENHIDIYTFKDQVIFEKDEILKDDSTPYVVYTPYSKKWLERLKNEGLKFFPSENELDNTFKSDKLPFLSLKDIGFERSNISVENFTLTDNLIDTYENTRNFPAKDGTSKISPHLRFGCVSIRKIVNLASKSNNITYLKELIWREFFMHILWHFPHTITKSFKPQYDKIKWRNNLEEFKAWKEGQTGYPIVDAGMRELNETGFMHNRVRMIVGSFLCKHLLIDWRWGEAYFAEKLHDYEMSSNIGNWQWVAGCGVDAAPYFRIFNPISQIEKFDSNHDYIKKWVPEYQELTYAQPIVEHKLARERCLETYKTALSV